MEPVLSIVIPVFNEEKNLSRLYSTWVRAFSDLDIRYHFVFINDGSTDDSLRLLETFAAEDENVSVVNQSNQGHGPSIITGYKAALNAEWIMQMDADNPYDTDAFAEMWRHKEQYDLLVGGRKEKNAGFYRKLISLLSVFWAAVLTGKFFEHINTPYRLMRSTDVRDALAIIPPDSFAPNIMLSMYYIRKRRRIFVAALRRQPIAVVKKSSMSSYIAAGAVKSLFQLIKFRSRL
ncbi:MAG: glycosyltransferase family 2 protein [Chitinophagaceae bacterium]|nr:glycosyltransferase family 2 protein [Chitinophagaceae bacterium]